MHSKQHSPWPWGRQIPGCNGSTSRQSRYDPDLPSASYDIDVGWISFQLTLNMQLATQSLISSLTRYYHNDIALVGKQRLLKLIIAVPPGLRHRWISLKTCRWIPVVIKRNNTTGISQLTRSKKDQTKHYYLGMVLSPVGPNRPTSSGLVK